MLARFLAVGIFDIALMYVSEAMPLHVPILIGVDPDALASDRGVICVQGDGCAFAPDIPFVQASAMVVASMAIITLFRYLSGLRTISAVTWLALLLSAAFSLPIPFAFVSSGGEVVVLTNMYSSYTPVFYLLASIHAIVENLTTPIQRSTTLVDYSDLTEDTIGVDGSK